MTNLERIREELLGDTEKATAFLDALSSGRHPEFDRDFCAYGKKHGMCDDEYDAMACRDCIKAWLEAEA